MTATNPQDRGTWTSASAAEADLACPGRHLAQRGIEEKEAGADAVTGREVHAVLALQGTAGHKAAYDALAPDQRDIHDRCAAIEARKVAEFFGQEAANPAMKVIREQRFWVRFPLSPDNPIIVEHSGQPDVVYRLALRGLVVDFKTLFGDHAESSANLQCRDNACLVRGQLLCNEVGAVLIQPWVNSDPKIALYEQADLDQATGEMFARVAASNDPNSRRVAGERQCGYCKAKRLCQTYQQWSGAMVPAMLSILDVPMAEWTPEERALAADRLGAAQDWLDTLKDFLKESLAKDASSVPGWALSPGTKRETITDPQGVFDRWCKLVPNLPVEQKVAVFMQTVTVKKGGLREILAHAGLKGKALQSAIESMLEGLVEVKFTAPSLARTEKAGSK